MNDFHKNKDKTRIFGIYISEPVFPIETHAYNYLKSKRFTELAWNGKEVFAFSLFINYLRRLKLENFHEIDIDFMNKLRANVISTFMEGSLNKEQLRLVNETISCYINDIPEIDHGDLLANCDLIAASNQRDQLNNFCEESFEDALSDLRRYRLHTEAALLEVVKELGLTIKEAMLMNPCLALESALTEGYIVVQNQSGNFKRQVPVNYIEQMAALNKLAVNRLAHDPDESYQKKRYPYLLPAATQIKKHLENNNLSIYAVRHSYFENEVLRNADESFCTSPVDAEFDADALYRRIKNLCFSVSQQMGHQFCYDDNYPLLNCPLDVRKVSAAQSEATSHPRRFLVSEPVTNYLRPVRKAKHIDLMFNAPEIV